MGARNIVMSSGSLKLAAQVTVGTNGDNARSAPVKIVANSGQPIEYDGFGIIVFDLDSYSVKGRIPLDRDHDDYDSIGYLSQFSVTAEGLVCGGAIVIADDYTAALVAKMQGGVPYQASVEADNYQLELVDVGESQEVNGITVNGPLWIVRDWELLAVAVCKWGADSDTSSSIAASKKKISQSKKVYFGPLQNTEEGKQKMDDNTLTKSPAVEVATEAKAVDVATEATKGEAVSEVSQSVETQEVVDADTSVEVAGKIEKEEDVEVAIATPIAASKPVETKAVDAVDSRAEFRQFVADFGDKAGEYYAEGLSLVEATKRFTLSLKNELEEVKKKLSLSVSDRGGKNPIKFSETASKEAQPQGGIIRIAGRGPSR